jgi:V8-like Glu-specific endopeptidase
MFKYLPNTGEKISRCTLCFSALALVLVGSGNVTAQVDGPVSSPLLKEPQEVEAYWTPERIANAQPMPTPTWIITSTGRQPMYQEPEHGVPTTINGHPPGGGEYTPHVRTYPPSGGGASPGGGEYTPQVQGPQAFGPGPSHPTDYANYGKFQRWTMHGKYVTWPRSLHGKLFFTLNGAGWVCSATVTNRSTIITAGHCVSDGAGNWASNLYFCPSYNQGGENATFGCWSAGSQFTTSNWHTGGDPDYDYACATTATTGTVQANKIGNVTGWAGRAWNWGAANPEITFGYPAASPFGGTIIQQTASVEWYEWDFTAGGLKSKLIGSDLTGGSSGGGWFLSWKAPGFNVADTDGSGITDPANAGGPHINGINSHKRCLQNCNTPPSSTAGLFWQEMSSPQFWSSAEADNDSEDVFALCFDHDNNDP